MTIAEDLWLRGQAAQQTFMHIVSYNTAFLGTAAVQGVKLGLTAPMGFWAAVGRASAGVPAPKSGATVIAKPKPAARRKPPARATNGASGSDTVVALTPKPETIEAVPAPAEKAPVAPKPDAKASEPVAAAPKAAKPDPAPKPKQTAAKKTAADPAPAPVEKQSGPSPHLLDAPRHGKPDDLTVLAGVGTKLATSLNEFGIYHFDQIAALDEEGIAWLDEQQKGFRMICARYDLIGQAKVLS